MDNQVTNKGTYCLIIRRNETGVIEIGRKGRSVFPKGYYCYVGSALNNLRKRIDRHHLKGKPLRWHVDYLLEQADLLDVRTIASERRLECLVSRAIEPFGGCIMKGFGSSDCSCLTHLHYFKRNPVKLIENTIRKVLSNDFQHQQ